MGDREEDGEQEKMSLTLVGGKLGGGTSTLRNTSSSSGGGSTSFPTTNESGITKTSGKGKGKASFLEEEIETRKKEAIGLDQRRTLGTAPKSKSKSSASTLRREEVIDLSSEDESPRQPVKTSNGGKSGAIIDLLSEDDDVPKRSREGERESEESWSCGACTLYVFSLLFYSLCLTLT